MGGTCDDPAKLRLLCARHNAHCADEIYGREHMSRFRAGRTASATAKPIVPGLFVREPELAWGEAGAA